DGLAADLVISLFESRDSSLWIATDGGGISRFHQGRFHTYTTKEGLPSNVVFRIYEDGEGIIWAGTNTGFCRIKVSSDDRININYITSRNGLYSDAVFQIFEDNRKNFWFGTDRGVFSVPRESLVKVAEGKAEYLISTGYSEADGMKSGECSAPALGCKTPDGRLWFPTLKGVSVFDPNAIRKNPLPPPVLIERVVIDKAVVSTGEAFELAPGAGKFEFHYTALSFIAPEKVRFKYQLEGNDKEWIDAGTQRVAYYTNLPQGNYRFRVKACNNDGLWNETGVAVTFYQQPFFYQTVWFYALGAIALVGAGAGAARFRVKQLQQRQRELEAIVVERTLSLQREKEKAEEARRDALSQKEIAESANQLKTELLSLAAHDLKNPLQGIIGYTALIQERNTDEKAAGFLESIGHSSQRMVKLISDLLQTSAIESGKIELQLTTLDVAMLAAMVVKNCSDQAAQKSQHIEFVAAEDCFATADAGLLVNVIENLISNAIKYSPHGKTIWVSIEKLRIEETANFRSALDVSHFAIRISVRDEGLGLSAEEVPKLFMKFQRLSSRPTGGESSSGLGLSIVKQLVELHGGTVSGSSEGKGKGSVFSIDLPAFTNLRNAAREAVPEPAAQGGATGGA
ncbi:MAG: hypothetical protein IAF08_02400, partial [Rhizobacter sp.]|nr:hypothetical protein [Chlorobiales bacterium]